MYNARLKARGKIASHCFVFFFFFFFFFLLINLTLSMLKQMSVLFKMHSTIITLLRIITLLS